MNSMVLSVIVQHCLEEWPRKNPPWFVNHFSKILKLQSLWVSALEILSEGEREIERVLGGF